MAAAPLILLEEAVKAIGVAIGVGIAADAAKQQTKDNTDAKEKSVAKTETTTREKKACEKCPPDCGELVEESTKGWPPNSILYQQRICNMPLAPIDKIHEWKWNGPKFDGFDSKLCMLKEAKANYDVFFDTTGEYKHYFVRFIFRRMLIQAQRQMVAVAGSPSVSLTWYFQTPITYKRMQPDLSKAGIVVLLAP
jgi:Restriction endonuclease fold toxin 5